MRQTKLQLELRNQFVKILTGSDEFPVMFAAVFSIVSHNNLLVPIDCSAVALNEPSVTFNDIGYTRRYQGCYRTIFVPSRCRVDKDIPSWFSNRNVQLRYGKFDAVYQNGKLLILAERDPPAIASYYRPTLIVCGNSFDALEPAISPTVIYKLEAGGWHTFRQQLLGMFWEKHDEKFTEMQNERSRFYGESTIAFHSHLANRAFPNLPDE